MKIERHRISEKHHDYPLSHNDLINTAISGIYESDSSQEWDKYYLVIYHKHARTGFNRVVMRIYEEHLPGDVLSTSDRQYRRLPDDSVKITF